MKMKDLAGEGKNNKRIQDLHIDSNEAKDE